MIRRIALLILGTALASCASGTHKIVDMIPEWAGGLPKGVPPRPGTPEYWSTGKVYTSPPRAARNRKTRKNPTPHNRPPQSAASSFIVGRSAQGSAGGERAPDGLAGNVSSTTGGQGARLGRRIDVGSRGHSRIPVIPSLTQRRCRPTRTSAPSSSVLIYSPAHAAGVRLSPRSARVLPPSSRSRLPVGVLHEPDAISVTPRATSHDRPRSTSSAS